MPLMTQFERFQVRTAIEPAEVTAAYDILRGILPGWDPGDDPDPLIDAPMFAELAGVAPNTPGAWQQRTKEGTEKVPFPEPGEPKYRDKPQWFAISQALLYLIQSGRWPRGTVARVGTRATVRPRLSFTELRAQHSALAENLIALGANDKGARTLQGWRSLATRRAGEQAKRAA